MDIDKESGVAPVAMRVPVELEARLGERMRVTLRSLPATVGALLEEGMWLDLPRLARALPEGEKVQLVVRLPVGLVSRVRERLAWTGRSQNAEMVFLVASALEHEADDDRLEAEQVRAMAGTEVL